MASSLGDFERLVLLAVARLSEAYGVSIRLEIEARTGRDVSAGAVYTTLLRLESQGLVSSELSAPSQVRGGRRKRVYRLEPAGEKALSSCLEELRRMTQGMEARFRLV
ncbi:MAG TPA: PadR family transcriptional regulator [Thermoanaerobaculia bacterium]|nr:PadR family transcriptional regulator [Thermoanaerobaculia bacterium]